MIRSILSLTYSLIVRVRLLLYTSGLKKTRRLNSPVISIGNITLGGTGKTPFTIYLAKKLRNEGFSPAVLSRGYRGSAEKMNLLVSNGRKLLCSAEESGDEPRLMAEKLPGIKVAVGANRFKSASLCHQEKSPETNIFILDDGFQHVQLKRDLDIVLIDATNPFGGEMLVPSGILREPLSSLARADAFVITRCHLSEGTEEISQRLREFNPSAPIFPFKHRITTLSPVDFPPTEPSVPDLAAEELNGKRALVLAAIGNPLQFLQDLEDLGLTITGTILKRDHHPYTQGDIDAAADEFRRSGADFIVTSEKDEIRIRHLDPAGAPFFSAVLEVNSDCENDFSVWLMTRLKGSMPS